MFQITINQFYHSNRWKLCKTLLDLCDRWQINDWSAMASNKNLLIINGYVLSLFCDCLAAIFISSTAVNAYNSFVIVFWCLFSKFLISFFIYLLQNYNKNNQSIRQVLDQLCQVFLAQFEDILPLLCAVRNVSDCRHPLVLQFGQHQSHDL